jgi:hypothetical protein
VARNDVRASGLIRVDSNPIRVFNNLIPRTLECIIGRLQPSMSGGHISIDCINSCARGQLGTHDDLAAQTVSPEPTAFPELSESFRIVWR